MKNWKNKFLACTAASMLLLSRSMTVLAVSEADVEAVGKEAASGNLLIWFLCAIAFLKVSQKIDSFMGSLGINVGHTGGSMIAELMVAARGITTVKNISGGGSFHGGSFHGGGNSNSVNNASFLSGGLAGAVGRQFAQSAMQTMTGQSSNPISRRAFESSVKKGGDFANSVTGAVAQGNINYTGSMTGRQAAQALTSYMGQTGIPDAPSYSGVEIGGGRIMGTETSVEHPNGTAFGMYHADQYMAPEGSYETVTMADNSTWYRQYATDTVERTPYMTGEGKIAYHQLHMELERLVLKLKHNREKVPLDVLKTKYAAGYTALSQKICRAASDYAKMVTIDGIRICPEFADEGITLINDTIVESGILKELSRSLFRQMDIVLYDSLLSGFREKLLKELQAFYEEYTVLQADFDHPEEPPRKVCLANHCTWKNDRWIPLETLQEEPAQKAV